ncbi:MAG: hypothetical protein JWM21_3645 [Acidobacteria bacterium]|nr:hypothetical protein [Acidobacteriota bacterium]
MKLRVFSERNPHGMMEPKRTKYDTNPLDPDVARKTEQVWGEGEDVPTTGAVKGATTPVGPRANQNGRGDVYSEAPTRTFDAPPASDSSYPSVFVPPTYAPPAEVYKPPQSPYPQPIVQSPASRNVTGLGLPEKWAVMLPYAPYIGVVASILELILVPRNEVRVRGHASQALALHIAIVAIGMMFGVLGAITGSSAGGSIFRFAAFVFLIISLIRVGQGATHRIAPLTDPADWLNKHIEPRK